MRYWLLTLVFALCVCGVARTQDKKKEFGKDKKEFKDKKDLKDKKDAPPEFKEPSDVLGKSFDHWRSKIHADDPTEREMAMKNILFFGSNKAYEAMPDILAELKAHKGNPNIDLSVRVNGIQAVSTIFKYHAKPNPKHVDAAYALYLAYLRDPQVILRLQTVKGLPYLGPKAKEAIFEVAKLADDPISWEMRKEAIPVLAFLCKPDTPEGTPNAAAFKVMRKRFDPKLESSHLVRATCVEGIGLLATGFPKELNTALDDPTSHVRLAALQAIAGMGTRDQLGSEGKSAALKRLDEYLAKEKDVALNMWAHAAIMTVKRKVTKDEIEPIARRLKHPDVPIRLLAIQIIGLGGKDSKPFALGDMQQAVYDKEVNVGVAAIFALVKMEADEEGTKSMLKSIVNDRKSHDQLHDAAVDALFAFEVAAGREKEKKDKKKDDKK